MEWFEPKSDAVTVMRILVTFLMMGPKTKRGLDIALTLLVLILREND